MMLLGTITILQVQIDRLKQGEKPNRYYEPANLRYVPTARLTHDGVIGMTESGEPILDIHNSRHPHTRGGDGNGISIGLTGHYAAMRDRFGDHVTDGIAGENLIIDCPTPHTLADLTPGVRIVRADGKAIDCDVTRVVQPCLEFSGFCARQTADDDGTDRADLKEVLRFLGDGRRGFFIAPRLSQTDFETFTVAVGDTLYLNA